MFLSHISLSLSLSKSINISSGEDLKKTHNVYIYQKKVAHFALSGVAQWIEHGSEKQRVAGSIPSQGTCPGCRPGPRWGACER